MIKIIINEILSRTNDIFCYCNFLIYLNLTNFNRINIIVMYEYFLIAPI